MEFPEALNLCVEYVDKNVREGRGERTALLYRDERYTYREVLEHVCKAANLLESLGLQREQRVLLMLSDHPEFVWFWFAAVRMGAVVSAVSPDCKPEELAYYLDYTRSRILVAEERLAGGALRLADAKWLEAAVFCRGEPRLPLPPRSVRWEDEAPKLSADHTPAETVAEDVGVMLYTGGSTGFPKAVVHRHVDFLYNTHTYGLPVLGLGPEDVTVGVPKLFFGYALGTNLLFPFRVGATVALFSERSTAERVLEEIDRRKATVLCSVPTMLNAMVHLEHEPNRYDWSRLRITTSAGEALPPELYRRYREKFGHEVLDGIGSAELFHVYISNRPGDVEVGSLGKVVEGYEARIRDDDGRDLPDGELGSLWIRGVSMGLGYFMRTEASRKVFRGEWFVSADKFRRDAEGRFWYGGRTDDLLKVGGRFLAPIEVENVLLAHPAVQEVAVVGYVDEEGLEKPRAFVVPAAGHAPGDALASELQALAKARLQPWKYPRQVVFRDSLPKSDRGKVLKSALRG
ncbi:benzoate-CoA ligase family protein [Vulgatibacter incomptus]|uniref:Benzoate-CoA ligase n=1 Tax=Vulgatibacter incomptus TaxID=1391653 RepID=A0A0K1PFR0_9BACT|nr:benzoate-CoA ligase family protein [Vulgatibacter incomptus]AKU92246.1 Benzoate-CoA ligase [Vulgatibacter incomptus]